MGCGLAALNVSALDRTRVCSASQRGCVPSQRHRTLAVCDCLLCFHRTEVIWYTTKEERHSQTNAIVRQLVVNVTSLPIVTDGSKEATYLLTYLPRSRRPYDLWRHVASSSLTRCHWYSTAVEAGDIAGQGLPQRRACPLASVSITVNDVDRR